MRQVPIRAIVATTHFMESRGIALSVDVLRTMADRTKPGDPIYREHGVERIGHWVKAEARERPDGEWELVAEGLIDLPDGEDINSYVGRAFSVGILEDSGDRPGNAPAVLGIDSLAFRDLTREGAAATLGAARSSIVVDWYHQFSQAPDPALVVFLTANFGPVFQGVAGSAMWEGLKLGVAELVGRLHPSHEYVTFRMKGLGVDVDAKVPTSPRDSAKVIEALFAGAAEILRSAK